MLDLRDVRTLEIRTSDIRPADVRPADVRPADIRSADIRPADIRPADIRPADIRPADIRLTQGCQKVNSLGSGRSPLSKLPAKLCLQMRIPIPAELNAF